MRQGPKSSLRHRATWAMLALASVQLFAGCADDELDNGTSRSSVSATPTTTEASTTPFGMFGSDMGAIDTVLIYCTPGLPDSPREGCDLGRIRDAITDMTTSMQAKIEESPDQATYADVSTAIDGMNTAISGLTSCDAWFAAGGSDQDTATSLGCGQSWDSLTLSWQALTSTVHWP